LRACVVKEHPPEETVLETVEAGDSSLKRRKRIWWFGKHSWSVKKKKKRTLAGIALEKKKKKGEFKWLRSTLAKAQR